MKKKLPINPSVYHKLGKNDPRRVEGYFEASGGGSAMSAAAGMSIPAGKSSSINVSGHGGKDEYGSYGGYRVTGTVSIPIGRKNEKRRK